MDITAPIFVAMKDNTILCCVHVVPTTLALPDMCAVCKPFYFTIFVTLIFAVELSV